MSKSLITLKSKKLKTPGIPSPQGSATSIFKGEILKILQGTSLLIEENVWSMQMQQIEERIASLGPGKKGIINLSRAESVPLLFYHLMSHENLKDIIDDIIKVKQLSFLKVKLIFESALFMLDIQSEVLGELLIAFNKLINSKFHRLYSECWQAALSTRSEREWFDLLEAQEERLPNQRQVFNMYWTIYRAYQSALVKEQTITFDNTHQGRLQALCAAGRKEIVVTHNIEQLLADKDNVTAISYKKNIDTWLWQKAKSFRIKIKVSCTERQLITFIEQIWCDWFRGPLIEVDSVENFVKTHFLCKDSRYDCKFYRHNIKTGEGSELIKFMRYLFHHESFFDNDRDGEVPLIECDRLKEIQLWFEFSFYGRKGFSESNIEIYFTGSTDRQTVLSNFNYITQRYPEGFRNFFQKSR